MRTDICNGDPLAEKDNNGYLCRQWNNRLSGRIRRGHDDSYGKLRNSGRELHVGYVSSAMRIYLQYVINARDSWHCMGVVVVAVELLIKLGYKTKKIIRSYEIFCYTGNYWFNNMYLVFMFFNLTPDYLNLKIT